MILKIYKINTLNIFYLDNWIYKLFLKDWLTGLDYFLDFQYKFWNNDDQDENFNYLIIYVIFLLWMIRKVI